MDIVLRQHFEKGTPLSSSGLHNTALFLLPSPVALEQQYMAPLYAGVPDTALPAGSVVGRLKKGTVVSAGTCGWEKAPHGSHPVAGQFSATLYVSGNF